MMEARKCKRCGCMYISELDVCERCRKKDSADLYRLKGFIESQGVNDEFSKGELAIATGISNRNLSRFLGYDEFKDIFSTSRKVGKIDGANSEEGFVELV